MNRKEITSGYIILVLIIVIVLLYINDNSRKYSNKVYSSNEFGIHELTSTHDEDKDGIDDYTDLYEGAMAYINQNPKYKSKYYQGGYPEDDYGVCTDVIWNAFQAAGYNLKDQIDTDIKNYQTFYIDIKKPDPNIDFRRVKNLKIFFERYAKKLTTDFKKPEEWQRGDIIVFTNHIAICSDKRNKNGIPFIIHFNKKGAKEANDIYNYKIVGHYRWNNVE